MYSPSGTTESSSTRAISSTPGSPGSATVVTGSSTCHAPPSFIASVPAIRLMFLLMAPPFHASNNPGILPHGRSNFLGSTVRQDRYASGRAPPHTGLYPQQEEQQK